MKHATPLLLLICSTLALPPLASAQTTTSSALSGQVPACRPRPLSQARPPAQARPPGYRGTALSISETTSPSTTTTAGIGGTGIAIAGANGATGSGNGVGASASGTASATAGRSGNIRRDRVRGGRTHRRRATGTDGHERGIASPAAQPPTRHSPGPGQHLALHKAARHARRGNRCVDPAAREFPSSWAEVGLRRCPTPCKRGRGFAQRLRQCREAIQSQIRSRDLEVTPKNGQDSTPAA